MAYFFDRQGAEIQANTTTSGSQGGGKIAVLSGGGFVVVWGDSSGTGADADWAVRAQLFDADGAKIGGEFLVNTTTIGTQTVPAVAALGNGGFVVTWMDFSATGGDTSSTAVRGQVFEADGDAIGGEFLVNTSTALSQSSPSVAALAGGGFAVAWQDTGATGGDSSGGIKAQRFDDAGAKLGGEFLVNTVTTGLQTSAQLAALSDGKFAAAWMGPSTENGYVGVQLFDATGAKLGGEQAVVESYQQQVSAVRIAALESGYVVVWSQIQYLGSEDGFELKAQRFDATGMPVGPIIDVNTTVGGDQHAAFVLGLPGGGFIVTWGSPDDGVGGANDVYAQVFDAAGAREGTEFVVNAQTDGAQGPTSLAVLDSGDVVFAWSDLSGGTTEVELQFLTATTTPASDIAISTTEVSETAVENLGVATLSASGGALNATYSFEIVSDSTGGAFGVDGDQLTVVDNGLLDFETSPTAQVRVRATANGVSFEETLDLTIADVAAEYRYSLGEAFQVNTTDERYDNVSSITPLATGGLLVVYEYQNRVVSQFQI